MERPGVSQVRNLTLVFVVGIQKSLCVAKGPDKRLMITNVSFWGLTITISGNTGKAMDHAYLSEK